MMDINITAQRVDMPAGFSDIVDEKSVRLAKTAPEGSTLTIVLTGYGNKARGKDGQFKVRARLVGKGVDESVQSRGRTPTSALDGAVDVLCRSVRHAKERRVKKPSASIHDASTVLSADDAAAE